jgi:hypothetical protein
VLGRALRRGCVAGGTCEVPTYLGLPCEGLGLVRSSRADLRGVDLRTRLCGADLRCAEGANSSKRHSSADLAGAYLMVLNF